MHVIAKDEAKKKPKKQKKKRKKREKVTIDQNALGNLK
jgi:hypothetical protein